MIRKIKNKRDQRQGKTDRSKRCNCLKKEEGTTGKDFRENGIVVERGFSERSSAVRRQDKGSWKEDRVPLEKKELQAQADQRQVFQATSAREPTCVGLKRRKNRNNGP